MKKMTWILLTGFVFAACKEDTDTKTIDANTDTTATTAKEQVALPYSVEKTPDWEKGDDNNIVVAMNALKAFETNDLNNIGQYFADTVEFYYDNGAFKGSRDSLVKMMKTYRDDYSKVSVKMHDYESVKSKSRNEEWVGLWYTEIHTDKKGKTDSVMVMDDLRIVNGKVAELDSKTRRLAPKKQ